jgi:protein tyrosine phosphatase (PTP) superfamily phosphohydrolase (DUF442 family)
MKVMTNKQTKIMDADETAVSEDQEKFDDFESIVFTDAESAVKSLICNRPDLFQESSEPMT